MNEWIKPSALDMPSALPGTVTVVGVTAAIEAVTEQPAEVPVRVYAGMDQPPELKLFGESLGAFAPQAAWPEGSTPQDITAEIKRTI